MNKVEIVADSKNTFGQRITSIVATFPRMLLAEVNTHRVFSRNSASSRAIRFQQMVKNCLDNPFIPFRFQKDHAGMQGTEYFEGAEHDKCVKQWLEARDGAVTSASLLNLMGVTKQLANRILEPFQYHTALITATEWENFINLRVSPFAEDHFQDLSEKILNALNKSEPKQLGEDEWHIPFGDNFDDFKLRSYLFDQSSLEHGDFNTISTEDLKVKLATVRCARISYLNQGKETPIEEDLKLHDRLASSGHWSAFEHCARSMNEAEYYSNGIVKSVDNLNSYQDVDQLSYDAVQEGSQEWKVTEFGWEGNFRGFRQYRKMFPDENRTDSRLLKK